MIYPKTEIKVADVIAARQALPVGCEVKNGVIVPALSPSEAVTGKYETVDCAAGSTALGVYLIKTQDALYFSRDGINFSRVASFASDEPFAFEDLDGDAHRLVMAGNTTSMCIYIKSSKFISLKFPIFGGQLKNGRLFAADRENRFKLRWSGEGGGHDWEENISGAGWVNLESKGGRILNMITFGEKLIAVREHSLTVINAFGNPENFRIIATDTPAPRIIKNTAAVVCGKLVFFAEGGLHCFDGSGITPLSHPLEDEIYEPSFASAYGRNYMLCCSFKQLERKAVLFYDFDFNSSYIIDVPADKLVVTDKIYAYYPYAACTLERCEKYNFASGKVDFGTCERKHLDVIEIECDKPVDLIVSNGRTERIFKGVKGRFSADMCGVNFIFSVTGSAEIKNFKAYAEVLSGV